MVLVTLIWSANGLLIKLVDWPPMAISGLRSSFAVVALLPFVGKPRKWLSMESLAGGTAFAGALITFVIATKLTTAANAIFLQLTAPVYVALLSWWILKERISALDWIITGIILGGMLLFFGDNLTMEGFWGNMSAILSAVCWLAVERQLAGIGRRHDGRRRGGQDGQHRETEGRKWEETISHNLYYRSWHDQIQDLRRENRHSEAGFHTGFTRP